MNILEEYLVSLDFQTDEASFRKFGSAMADAERTVAEHTGGIAKYILEAQATITGAFIGFSTAIVGLVDKIAMADQSYRLLGLRMFMTTNQARKLDFVTKALGADLSDIVFDPSGELLDRAIGLSEVFDKLSDQLGPKFERNMRAIRDVRMEVSRFGMDLKFLGMELASDLADKLLSNGNVLAWFDDKLRHFEADLPAIAEALSKYVVPALRETWTILKLTEEALESGATAFTNIVGLLSGDTDIIGSTFQWEHFAEAISHVAHGLEYVIKEITKTEKLLGNTAGGVAAFLGGKPDAAKKEFSEAKKNADPLSVLGAGISTAAGISFAISAVKIAKNTIGKMIGSVTELGEWIGGTVGKVGGLFRGGAAVETAAGVEAAGAAEVAGTGEVVGAGAAGAAEAAGGGLLASLGPIGIGALTALGVNWIAGKAFPKFKDWEHEHIFSPIGRFFTGSHKSSSETTPSAVEAPLAKGEVWSVSVVAISDSAIRDLRSLFTGFDNTESPETPNASPIASSVDQLSSHADLANAIKVAADKYAVPEALALAVARQESGINQSDPHKGGVITSSAGALGVMQLMPQTARYLGVDPTDAGQNIDGGVRYLAQLLKQFNGDQVKAIAAYNAGAGRVRRTPDFQDLPAETRNYVPKVLQYEREFASLSPMPKSPYGDEDPTTRAKAFDNQYLASSTSALISRPLSDGGLRNEEVLAYLQRLPVGGDSVSHREQNIDIGGINVYITQAGPNLEQIRDQVHAVVATGVRDALRDQTRGDLVQLPGQW